MLEHADNIFLRANAVMTISILLMIRILNSYVERHSFKHTYRALVHLVFVRR